jgi:hypothetical protein
MARLTLYWHAPYAWAAIAMLLACAIDDAFAQSAMKFTPGRVVTFNKVTAKGQEMLLQVPVARDIVAAGSYFVAQEDFDDDGQHEIILISRSSSLCSADGCAMLILRKGPAGTEILLLQKVAVAKHYALTEQKVDGYRALAALDESGAIVERRNATGSGTQLVFILRAGSQAAKAGVPSSPPVARAPSTNTTRSGTIELVELVNVLLPPARGSQVLGDWALAAPNPSSIRWRTKDVEGTAPAEQKAGYAYQRIGDAVITIDGKPTHQDLTPRPVPGVWKITLLGPRAGYARVVITAWAQGLAPMLEGFKKELPSRHYKCNPQSAMDGNNVYLMQVPGKAPAWVDEQWSCGTQGCLVSWDIVFTQKEADRFKCL